MLVRLNLRWSRRLDAFAGDHAQWAVVDAGSTVDLDDNARDQLLNAFHFARLIRLLVELTALAAAPLAELPEGRAWLTVALHEALADDRLLQVSALFWRVGARRFTSHAANNRLLWSAAARFAARSEAYHLPWQLPFPATRRGRVDLRIRRLQLVVQRQVVFARWEVIGIGSFFRCGERRWQQIFIFYARINLLRENLKRDRLTIVHHAMTWRLLYHQMNWLEQRSRASYPFGDAIASLRMMRVLQITVEAMIVNRGAGHFIRSTVRDGVVAVYDVFAAGGFQCWKRKN